MGPVEIPDEYKVSCFVCTADGSRVITGSSTGSPHVFDVARSGELVRVMDGVPGPELLACSHDLHLAVDETLLVGLVSVDPTTLDPSLPSTIRRVQVHLHLLYFTLNTNSE